MLKRLDGNAFDGYGSHMTRCCVFLVAIGFVAGTSSASAAPGSIPGAKTHGLPEARAIAAQILATPTPANPAPPAQDAGYHEVSVKSAGKTATIRVKDSVGPRLKGEATSGKYDPTALDLSRSSSFSHKSFSPGDHALSGAGSAPEVRQDPFLTHSYPGAKNAEPIGQTYQTAAFVDDAHPADSFQKTFATNSSKITRDQDAAFAKSSTDRNRRADLQGPATASIAGKSTLGDKTFFDPELTHVRRDPYAAASGLDVAHMAALPNRPLTIDEVRDLINHETVPDLNNKPAPPSPALNDPHWEPPTFAPFKEKSLPAPPEEKDAELPSPGMMATPTEPLPK